MFTGVIKVFIASVDIKRGTVSGWTFAHVSPDFKEVNYNVLCRKLENQSNTCIELGCGV